MRAILAFVIFFLTAEFSHAQNTYSPEQIFRMIEKNQEGGYNFYITNYLYEVGCPQGNCYDFTAEEAAAESQNMKTFQLGSKAYVIAVPTNAGSYNRSYMVFLARNSGSEFHFAKLLNDTTYDAEQNEVVSVDLDYAAWSGDFINFEYDDINSAFTSTNLGSSDGYCIRKNYYRLEAETLVLFRVTQTSDCGKSPAPKPAILEEETIYQRN